MKISRRSNILTCSVTSKTHMHAMLMLLAILLGLTGNFLPQIKSFEYPEYVSSVSTDTWFLREFEEYREYLHSELNASTFFIRPDWNISSVDYNYMWIRGSALSAYTLACVHAYELTQNAIYLAEAVWLVDNWLAHEGENTGGKKFTWQQYERHPNSCMGFFHNDVYVWWAMQKLNEHGYNYDVTTRINYVIDSAIYNNDTDLGWEYYWHQQTGDPANYLVNTNVVMLALLAYLDYKGVSDYSSEVTRAYTSIEKFRHTDKKYKYKINYDDSEAHYTLIVLCHLLIAHKYQPSILNSTAIQETVDAMTYSDVWGSSGRNLWTAAGAGITLYTNTSAFTIPDTFNRTLRWVYEYGYQESADKLAMGHWIRESKREAIVSRAQKMLFSLMQTSGVTITLKTPAHQFDNPRYYFNTRLENNTYLRGNSYYLTYPMQVANWFEFRIDDYPAGGTISTSFNATSGRFEGTYTYSGTTMTLNYDKFGKQFNWTAPSSIPWEIYVDNYYNDYDYYALFPNSTKTQINSNATHTFGTYWAFEIDMNSSMHFYIIKASNSTWISRITGTSPNLDLSVSSQLTEWSDETFFAGMSVGAGDKSTIESWIYTLLQRRQNNQTLIVPESIATKAQGLIIHSDANISNYNDQISSQNKLSFTLTYGSGQTSVTYIYCGNKGKPTAVYATNGTLTWSYNASTMILTLNVTHGSPTKILTYWKFPGDVNDDGIVDVYDLFDLSKVYGSDSSKPNWNPRCDLNGDNKVDASDLFDLSKSYGKTA